MLDLYDQGCRARLPFAPETSHTYASTLLDKEDEEAAREAAEKKWDGYYFPESDDLYLSLAWYYDGLIEAEDFGKTAVSFWAKFIHPSDSAQSTDDDAGSEAVYV